MALPIIERDVLESLKIFFLGLIDGLSFHKTIAIIVNNPPAGWILLQIVLANIFLLVGSLFMYERGIKPGIQQINSSWMQPSENEGELVLFAAYTVYHLLWILPIYILCYACSLTWFKDLSKCLVKTSKQTSSSAAVSVQDSIYSFLIWFFIWIQVQILYAWLPSFLSNFTVQNPNGVIASLLSSILTSISLTSFAIGLCLNCILYGWYAFDHRWIGEGCDTDTRVSQLENNCLYFIGFGLPYVLLFRFLKFFLAYGLYLSIFPFCMMIGAVTNYRHSMKKIKTIKFFTWSREWTLTTLKLFRFKANENFKKQLASSSKSSRKGKSE
jgi:hypothetical protein